MTKSDAKRYRSQGPELLVDLADTITQALVDLIELERERAEHVAVEVSRRMAKHWGGQSVYVPMGLSYNVSDRDKKIYADFNGTNHSDLVRKYGVSLQWIYKIVKAVRQSEMKRIQRDLFPD